MVSILYKLHSVFDARWFHESMQERNHPPKINKSPHHTSRILQHSNYTCRDVDISTLGISLVVSQIVEDEKSGL